MQKAMAKGEATTLSLGRYRADAKAWIVAAQAFADVEHHVEVTPLHLLSRGLDGHAGIRDVFARASINVAELGEAVARALSGLPRGSEPSFLSTRLLDLLARAERDADRERATDVTAAHVLNALSQEVRGGAGEILTAFGVAPGSLRPHLGALSAAPVGAAFASPSEPSDVEARDLIRAAREGTGDPVVGRDAEIRRLVTILERRDKCHALLVGEPGTGKRSIVRAFAKRVAAGDVPARLASARLLHVDAVALASSGRLKADAEARLRRVVEGGQTGKNGTDELILFVRGIDQLFGTGSAAQAGEALRSFLSRSAFRLVATTNPEGLRRISERDPGFIRLCTVLEVSEPSVADAIDMLRAVAARLETHHGVRIGDGAVVAAVTFAKRYLADRFLPDSAVGLLDEAAASLRVETDGVPRSSSRAMARLDSIRVQLGALEGVDDRATTAARTRLEEEQKTLEPEVAEMRRLLEERRAAKAAGAPSETPALTEEHVAATAFEWTGIPVAKMLEGEADKLLRMEERLERRVIGQSEGVHALSRAVRRGRVGLRDPRRPIGSFLFLGPSGVGKTELAKALAEFLFDDEAALTRLDMSEFMERHMAQRLLGAPPGYADSEQGGFLTEAVRKRPYSVLLFDEVEKAHEDVFNLLLQVLDDGRLTDGRGRLADFTNTVVILTSNIGSSRILETESRLFESAEGRDALRDVLMGELAKFFRPEFLNRIDDVIVFRPLTREDLSRIFEIQLASVQRLLAPRKLRLEVDENAKARLIDLGHQPALGARPLRRAILKNVQDPLAEKLLERPLPEGAILKLRLEAETFVFETVLPS